MHNLSQFKKKKLYAAKLAQAAVNINSCPANPLVLTGREKTS